MLWHPPTQEEIWAGAIKIRDAFRESDAEPFFIGRNGTIEVEVLYFWLTMRKGAVEPKEYPQRMMDQIQRNAGVFPSTGEAVDRWCVSYLTSIQSLSGTAAGWYMPTWHLENVILANFAPTNCFRTPLRSLEPYYHPAEFRWTQYLAGKRVAVVSSFAGTIQRQLWGEKVAAIWRGEQQGLLTAPNIEWSFVQTGYAPTTALGNAGWPAGLQDWSQAVKQVVEGVIKSGAQIALIGCGALGMIIGGHLRERGISVLVLGGAIQVLFGVKGKRWESHEIISKFWNDAWVWPAAEEIPNGARLIEGGCYWDGRP